jgi:hypothetical protein
MRGVINFASFYAGWFACVAGAGRGQLWLGPAVVAVLIGLHLALVREPWRQASLIAVVALVGWCVDTALASAGAYSFGTRSIAPWFCPPWMVALWAIFATTLTGSLSWLSGRYLFAALLGLVSGPLSYWYGSRLGAIDLLPNPLASLVILAPVWGAVTPALVRLASTLGANANPAPAVPSQQAAA